MFVSSRYRASITAPCVSEAGPSPARGVRNHRANQPAGQTPEPYFQPSPAKQSRLRAEKSQPLRSSVETVSATERPGYFPSGILALCSCSTLLMYIHKVYTSTLAVAILVRIVA